jgi:hypothetical protein
MPVLLAPLILLFSFWRQLHGEFRDPQFRAALGWVAMLLVAGASFYRYVEHWSWVDSLYFCVMTLATVGYGDFVPTTAGSKLFTALYVIMGMTIMLAFVQHLAKGRADLYMSRRASRGSGRAPEQATDDHQS